MLGKIILEQRKLLNIKSKHLAETVGIDPGFLTHIEKGDRNPSKSVLAKICKELHLSYEFMLSLSENSLKEESVAYNASIHTPAKKVLYAETFSLLDCPVTEENVSLIVKMDDDSMEDLIPKSSLIYIHYTSVLSILLIKSSIYFLCSCLSLSRAVFICFCAISIEEAATL